MKFLSMLAAMGACAALSAGAEAGAQATAATRTATAPQRPAATAASPGSCPVGSWRLSNLVHRPGRTTGLYFTGGGSMTAVFTKRGTWTFSDKGTKPLVAHFEAAGESYVGTATITGKVSGVHVRSGSTYGFDVRGSSGTVRISSPFGSETRPVRAVTAAFVPTGRATVRCSGSRLTIGSDAVVMTWTYTGPVRGGGAASPPPPPPPPPAGGPLVVSRSGTWACGGRRVTLTGRAHVVVLTGRCASVVVAADACRVRIANVGNLVVSGDGNNVTAARVSQIRASGTGNRITWQGADPGVVDTGTGNVIARG